MVEKPDEPISPERLDELLEVTDSKGWIALLGLLLLIAFSIGWIFLGKIPTRVNGTGMLINMGGIHTITSDSSGRIVKFDIDIGDVIQRDQPVAYILQTEILNDIKNLKEKIKEQIVANHERDEIREVLTVKYADEVSALKKKLEAQLKLLNKGITVESETLYTNEKITETNKKIEELKIEKLKDEHALRNLEREYKSLEEKYDENNVVRSPYKGVVTELKETLGSVVKPGTQLLTMEIANQASHKLEAIIYISALEGKRVLPGMHVRVIPSTISPQEYGAIKGVISFVSQYPATPQGINRVLQNEEMVKQILSKESQVEVHVNLIPSNKTYSQLAWTSENGPPLKIQSGTLCSARITLNEKRPIQLIIPKIKEWLGNE